MSPVFPYLEHPPIRELLVDGRASVLDRRYAASFDAYLCTLPWLTYSTIDWSGYPSAELTEADRMTWPVAQRFLQGTALRDDDHFCFIYSPTLPLVVVPAQLALAEIHGLGGPQMMPRYGFGASAASGAEVDLHFGHLFVYYTGLLRVATQDLQPENAERPVARLSRWAPH